MLLYKIIGRITRNSHDAFISDFVETLLICMIIEVEKDSFAKAKVFVLDRLKLL